MSRRNRQYVEGVSVHVIHRGNNHMPIFRDLSDRRRYLDMVRDITAECEVNVHGFTVMDTHAHFLVTPLAENALPSAMKRVGGKYTIYFNRQHGRVGTIWMGPYRRHLIEDERYWLTCLRYIEQNPVRAHMVATPADYEWSSYRVHAFGELNDWLVPHATYLQLGSAPIARQVAYRAICGVALDQAELTLLRRPARVIEETNTQAIRIEANL